MVNQEQVRALVLQSLEHEMGGVKVYETAVTCAVDEDLREEWTKYLEQTRTHVQRLQDVCAAMGIDPTERDPGRDVVKAVGGALVQAMSMALATGDEGAAQVVACEAVSLAEMKDHLDWELLGKCAEHMSGPGVDVLRDACEKTEDEEDEHLYHTKGWCRELWFKTLGLPAVLPPPEEEHHVKTAIGAARAEQASEKARERHSSKGNGMATRKTTSRKSASKKPSTRKTAPRKPSTKVAKKTAKTAARKTSKTAARKTAARKTSGASKTLAQKKVKRAMHERKEGTLRSGGSGKKVTSRKQAIAIGLSEAREAGARIPRKKPAKRA